jgi:Flp pilus assembly pilin Flp
MRLIQYGFLATLISFYLATPVSLAQGNIEDCLRNIAPEVTIINNIYDTYTARGIEAVVPQGDQKGVWWSRWSLEILRWVVSGGENGNIAPNTTPCDADAQGTDQWKALNEQFTDLESKVIEMETAKGLEFMGLQNDKGELATNGRGRTIYKDTESGLVYSWEDSQNF